MHVQRKHLLLILVFVAILVVQTSSSVAEMRLVDVQDSGNEALSLRARVAGRSCFFQLDTGYAGPPVLSSNYLAAMGKVDASRGGWKRSYAATIEAVRDVDDASRTSAVNSFLRRGTCNSYTSGCTMRLMGIGSIVEQQADMFLCDPIRFKTFSGRYSSPNRGRGDVLVTNPLPSSAHLLTFDYLRHLAPSVIDIGRGKLHLRMSATADALARMRYRMRPLRTMGGAPVVDVIIGHETFVCTLDTGSPSGVCIGSQAASRIPTSCRGTGRSVTQRGVNGESVCSTIVVADIDVNGISVPSSCIFVNDTAVDHSDGYVGLAVIRALDIYIGGDELGLKRSGLPPKSPDDFQTSPSTCVQVNCDA